MNWKLLNRLATGTFIALIYVIAFLAGWAIHVFD